MANGSVFAGGVAGSFGQGGGGVARLAAAAAGTGGLEWLLMLAWMVRPAPTLRLEMAQAQVVFRLPWQVDCSMMLTQPLPLLVALLSTPGARRAVFVLAEAPSCAAVCVPFRVAYARGMLVLFCQCPQHSLCCGPLGHLCFVRVCWHRQHSSKLRASEHVQQL
jgi:hypothetical protein